MACLVAFKSLRQYGLALLDVHFDTSAGVLCGTDQSVAEVVRVRITDLRTVNTLRTPGGKLERLMLDEIRTRRVHTSNNHAEEQPHKGRFVQPRSAEVRKLVIEFRRYDH